MDEFEENIKSESRGMRPPKNWPCKQYAFARNDITTDIPHQFQSAVKKFYAVWWLTVICTVANWISIIWFVSIPGTDTKTQDWLFATLYVILGCPLSWMLLYKRF